MIENFVKQKIRKPFLLRLYCHPQLGPTLVVDGMACLRHWYSCKDWVCGGQWREYMDVLKSWVEAFTSAGIRLVFFFDGVVKEQKRHEWVRKETETCGVKYFVLKSLFKDFSENSLTYYFLYNSVHVNM